MRRTFLTIAALALLAACPPSAARVRAAREAHYSGSPASLISTAESAVVGQQYRIGYRDYREGMIVTAGKWYGREGDVRTAGPTGAKVEDGSIMLKLRVDFEYHRDGDYSTLEVTPIMQRHVEGRSNRDDVAVDDPSAPSWAFGKADGLYVAINEALADRVVPTVPLAH